MRIAIASNLYPPIQTGTAYWTQELAETLVKLGHQVVVVTVHEGRELVSEECNGVKVFRLPPVWKLPTIKFFLNFNQFFLMNSRSNVEVMRKILRDHDIEVIHQCGQLLDSLLMTRKLALELGIPWVVSLHSLIRHPFLPYHLVMGLLDRTVVRYFMRGCDGIIGLCEITEAYGQSMYRPKRTTIVPLCISDSITEEPEIDPTQPSEFIHIVSVGHVTEMRDRTDLLDAVAILLREGMKLRLSIVGKVLTKKTLEKIDELGIGQQVNLLGEMKRDQLFNLLRTAHIEAHWLYFPAIGCASQEAMGLGLPVISYSSETIYGKDVPIRHGENIWLIDVDSQASIVAGIRTLATNPELRKTIGTNARVLIQNYLTWSSASRKLIEFYRAVTK
jgi:glycosyltransferase involved in cell wall biosynthesis